MPNEATSPIRTQGAMARYCLLSSLTWAAFLAAVMAGTYMLGRGISGAEVGVVMIAGNLAALVAQPFIASAADGPGPLDAQRLGIGLSLVTVGSMGACLLPLPSLAIEVLLVLTYLTAKNLPALSNSVAVYYVNRGGAIDYGVARAAGSVSNAAASFVVGLAVAAFGEGAIMWAGIVLFAALAGSFALMPTPKDVPPTVAPTREEAHEGESTGGYLAFCIEHPAFLLLVAGFSLGLLMPQIVVVYGLLVFENVGAGAVEMGTANAIASIVELPTMLLYSRLERRISAERLMLVAAAGCVLKAGIIAFATNVPLLYVGYALTIMSTLFGPASVSWVNARFGEGNKNKALGLMVMVSPIGGIVGNVFGSLLLGSGGIGMLLGVVFALAVVGAAIAVVGVRRS